MSGHQPRESQIMLLPTWEVVGDNDLGHVEGVIMSRVASVQVVGKVSLHIRRVLPGIKKKKTFDRGNTSIGLDTGAVEAMGKNEASAERYRQH